MPPVTSRLRLVLCQLLILLVLADALGLGAARVFAASADPHVHSAVQDTGAGGDDGTGDPVPGCTHACHLAYHLVAPVSESPATAAALDSHAPPVYTPHPTAAFRQKAPLQPPRARA